MTKRLFYPPNLQNEELNPAALQFQFFERKTTKESNIDDEIMLYMPQSASHPSTVKWTTDSVGAIGHYAIEGARTGQRDYQGLMNAAMQRVMKGGGYNLAAASVQIAGGKMSAEAAMGLAGGIVENPYLVMLFKGVDFRTFTFSFKFVPFTEKDTETIHDIIKTFRKNALPPGGESAAYQPYLGYPKECQITYLWKGKENQYLHKFKRAVCTGIDVDYTGQGMFAVMRNGMPASITLNTRWSEIEIVLRDDVEDGY